MSTLLRFGMFALFCLGVGFARANEPGVESNTPRALPATPSGWLPALAFEGNETFNERQIRDGLERNYDLILAMRTATPTDDPAPRIATAVKVGYLRAGFPAVKVEARSEQDTGAVRLRIVEGRRFTNGKIRITGTKLIAAELLARRLTGPWYPPEAVPLSFVDGTGKKKSVWVINEQFECVPEKPRWAQGLPAKFDQLFLKEIRAEIQKAFSFEGHFSPRFEVSLEPDRNRATSDLVVKVASEGEPAIVEDIVVKGADRFSRESLLEHLGVNPGMRYTGRTDAELVRRLWESGRYVRHEVSATFLKPRSSGPDEETLFPPHLDDEDSAVPVTRFPASSRVRLTIRVVENPFAPEFSAQLTEVEQALLKVAQWMERWSLASADEELALDIAMDLSKFSLLPVEGYELQARVAGGVDRAAVLALSLGRKGAPAAFQQTGAFTPQETVFLSSRSPRRYESRLPATTQLMLNVVAVPDRNPGKGPTESLLNFGFGLKALNENSSNPFQLRILIAPAAALKLKTLPGTQCEIVDGTLKIESDVLRMHFDARTGVLQRLQVQSAGLGVTIGARFEPGVVAGALKDFARLRRELPGADATAPRSDSIVRHFAIAACEFMAEESPDAKRPSAGALATLTARWQPPSTDGLLSVFREKAADGSEFFVVPAPAKEGAVNAAGISWNRSMSGALLSMARAILPDYGKLHEISRDSLLAFPDRSREYLLMETIDLMRGESCGPLSTLLQVALTVWDGQAVSSLARQGDLRMSQDLFEMDCRMLLSGDGWLSECLISLLAAARDLSHDEIRALTQLCPDAVATDAIATALIEWKSRPQAQAAQALQVSFPHLWNICRRSGFANPIPASAPRRSARVPDNRDLNARTLFGLKRETNSTANFWKAEKLEKIAGTDDKAGARKK